MHVAVVGAGVLGLSTALLAQQRGWTVSLYTDRLPLHTTSVKAGASFKPHAVAYYRTHPAPPRRQLDRV